MERRRGRRRGRIRAGGHRCGCDLRSDAPVFVEVVCRDYQFRRMRGVPLERRTLFDALPKAVLLCLAEAGHALSVSPADEVGLFELTHERLFACIRARRQEQFLGWGRDKVKDEAEWCEHGWHGVWTSGLGNRMVVVDEADGPMPAPTMSTTPSPGSRGQVAHHFSRFPSSLSNHQSSSLIRRAAASSKTTSWR